MILWSFELKGSEEDCTVLRIWTQRTQIVQKWFCNNEELFLAEKKEFNQAGKDKIEAISWKLFFNSTRVRKWMFRRGLQVCRLNVKVLFY